jgi:hypothetical protein
VLIDILLLLYALAGVGMAAMIVRLGPTYQQPPRWWEWPLIVVCGPLALVGTTSMILGGYWLSRLLRSVTSWRQHEVSHL